MTHMRSWSQTCNIFCKGNGYRTACGSLNLKPYLIAS